MVVHACNSSTYEAEAGGLLWGQGQPELVSKSRNNALIFTTERHLLGKGTWITVTAFVQTKSIMMHVSEQEHR